MHGNETFPHNSKRTLTWQLHRSCLYVCVMRKGKPKLILKKKTAINVKQEMEIM